MIIQKSLNVYQLRIKFNEIFSVGFADSASDFRDFLIKRLPLGFQDRADSQKSFQK